ncbi:MAG: hypothetical protein WKF70_11480 [Chitinophagaceae bacterium]
MNETFEIPVIYKVRELIFQAELLVLGYTHKIQVEVNGKNIFFEPDEERSYRAVQAYDSMQEFSSSDKDLIKDIAGAIEIILK